MAAVAGSVSFFVITNFGMWLFSGLKSDFRAVPGRDLYRYAARQRSNRRSYEQFSGSCAAAVDTVQCLIGTLANAGRADVTVF